MSIEKQNLSKKAYQNIVIKDVRDQKGLQRFHERLENQFFSSAKLNLFILQVKENNQHKYYVYDYFAFTSVDQLREIPFKELEVLSITKPLVYGNQINREVNNSGLKVFFDKRFKQFIDQWGYPHNYRSKMYFWKQWGVKIGFYAGFALGIGVAIYAYAAAGGLVPFAPILSPLIKILEYFGTASTISAGASTAASNEVIMLILMLMIFVVFVAPLCISLLVCVPSMTLLGLLIGGVGGAVSHYLEKELGWFKSNNNLIEVKEVIKEFTQSGYGDGREVKGRICVMEDVPRDNAVTQATLFSPPSSTPSSSFDPVFSKSSKDGSQDTFTLTHFVKACLD